MQISKQIINNPEMRSHLSEAFSSLRSRLTSSKLKTILLVSVISFTSLLVRQTLQVQHSCNPMIHWSGELPAECQVAVNTNSDSFDDFSYPRQQELKTPKQQPKIAPSSTSRNTVKSQPDKFINSPKATEPKIAQNITQSEPESQSGSIGQFVDEHSNDIVGVIAGVAGGVGAVAAGTATAALLPLIALIKLSVKDFNTKQPFSKILASASNRENSLFYGEKTVREKVPSSI